MRAYITASRPEEVAREVDKWTKLGCHSFVLRKVADGHMRDQERLGAARYAAGTHADVQLEAPLSPSNPPPIRGGDPVGRGGTSPARGENARAAAR